MAMGLLESGPKFNWTRDNKIFDRFQIWKEKVVKGYPVGCVGFFQMNICWSAVGNPELAYG